MGGWGRRRFPAVLPALGIAGYCWRGGEGGDGDGVGIAGGRRCFLAGQPLLCGGEIPACAGMTVEGAGIPACAGMTVGGAGVPACAGMTVGGAGIGAGGGVWVRRYRQGRIVNYGGISQ